MRRLTLYGWVFFVLTLLTTAAIGYVYVNFAAPMQESRR